MLEYPNMENLVHPLQVKMEGLKSKLEIESQVSQKNRKGQIQLKCISNWLLESFGKDPISFLCKRNPQATGYNR